MITFKLSCYFLLVFFIPYLINSGRTEQATGSNRQQSILYSVHNGRQATPNVTRSYRCLIEQVARKNHINATYTKISSKGTQHQPVFTFRLYLGRDSYVASSNSIKAAKEKVSREAYGATRYVKPKLKDRTCKNIHSDVSYVNEWAQKRGYQFTCSITDQKIGPPIKYTYECAILGTIYHAKAEGNNKNYVKTLAVQEVKRQTERNPDTLSRIDQGLKYNASHHFYLNPVSRLSQIQTTRHQVDPVYKILQELPGFSNRTHREEKTFIMGVKVKQDDNLEYTGVGKGTSLKEAKYHAAANVLGMMNYHVPQNMTEYKKKEKNP